MQTCHLGTKNEMPLKPSAHHRYRAIVGGLSCLAHCTRSDQTFSVALARSLHACSARHMFLAKRNFRYVNKTVHNGIGFKKNHPSTPQFMRATVEGDWDDCVFTKRSNFGFIFAVNWPHIFWKSKLQTVVALLSGEAEYIAISWCTKEVSWLRRLVYELVHRRLCLDETINPATVIETDSSAAQSMASNMSSTKLTDHGTTTFETSYKSRWLCLKRFTMKTKLKTG